ncbi:ketose-bisphosphate aldolase [Patescibacteria group bacterium]|nr:ketose-bisphosphate aldolase [Patescibacteria group bacterium]MBU1673089.1 ketose-bisphosphate aldolase [Patescibacteria group bacterium]MBU1963695.1 ketose-bisphosphate aldolase [Patescibacteria group bacterium]
MPLVPAKILLDDAVKNKYAVGAFNVNNMEQIQAIMAAAKETMSPVIIQASRGALEYSNLIYLKKLMEAAVIDNPEVPLAVHLDHGNSLETVKQAIDLGFTSVMIDGSLKEDSKTPTTFEENVEITKKVVEYAHPFGVTVEGELGTLGGIEDGVGSGEVNLTDPDQAVEFVKETGVDSLAVAIGTSHGAYKFKEEPKLALDIVKEINKKMPELPLVMHGSSSVPKELVDLVNKWGGKMPDACGVPVAQIQSVIPFGVAKVNVDTDGRMVITGTIRKILTEKPEEFDPRKYLGPARDALYEMIAERMKDFYTAGHASEIKDVTLEEAKAFYK